MVKDNSWKKDDKRQAPKKKIAKSRAEKGSMKENSNKKAQTISNQSDSKKEKAKSSHESSDDSFEFPPFPKTEEVEFDLKVVPLNQTLENPTMIRVNVRITVEDLKAKI